MFKRAPRLNQRLVFHVVNYDNYYLTWLILCVCFQTSPRSHWSVQHCKAHPSWWEIGISSTEMKGHLALGIKCWRPGNIPQMLIFILGFLSSFFLFSAGKTQLQGSQNPDFCGFVLFALRKSRIASPGMRGWTNPRAHPFHFFWGTKILGLMWFRAFTFPPFPTQKISQLSVFSVFSPFSNTLDLGI